MKTNNTYSDLESKNLKNSLWLRKKQKTAILKLIDLEKRLLFIWHILAWLFTPGVKKMSSLKISQLFSLSKSDYQIGLTLYIWRMWPGMIEHYKMILENEDITEKPAWINSGFNEIRTLFSLLVVGYKKQMSDEALSDSYVCYTVTFRWLKQNSCYIAFDFHFFNSATSRPPRVLKVIQNSVFCCILR